MSSRLSCVCYYKEQSYLFTTMWCYGMSCDQPQYGEAQLC